MNPLPLESPFGEQSGSTLLLEDYGDLHPCQANCCKLECASKAQYLKQSLPSSAS